MSHLPVTSLFCAPSSRGVRVLCQSILISWSLFGGSLLAQRDSTTSASTPTVDSSSRLTFPESKGIAPAAPLRERTLDMVIAGGAGWYHQGASSAFQSTANLDFFAQTSKLNLSAGFHYGFSDPSTKSVSIGLRFPLIDEGRNPISADANLLFFENPADTDGFRTGLRLALAGRNNSTHLEWRIVGELRKLPFGGASAELWGGAEVGFFINLLRDPIREMGRKDTLRSAIKYIATAEEIEALDRTTNENEINAWLDRFWRARDLTPATPTNEAEIEYMRRVESANRQFGSSHLLGTETDQGKALLVYGDPDAIEHAVSTSDPQRHYLLWTYERRIQGSRMANFLFVSPTSGSDIFAGRSGEYRQVYSNVPGERSEGLPGDLPVNMTSFLQSFDRR